jgi:tRNA 5-methylaminomethyl-2-thiouridine biosynthesis bifunctional protein
MSSELTPAQVELDASGTPYAPAFADCYFSRQDGLAESRYVFLQGNELPSRWQNKARFVIVETGFGTGLNFLATWQAWQQDLQRCTQLQFISIEKHPIPVEILRELLSVWVELTPFADELLANYPPLLRGMHRLVLAQGRVQLTLCFMPIEEALAQLVCQADAWFLDGFAPAKNPEMWQLSNLQGIARLSHTQTSLATFTAASDVRRTLMAAGFSVSKRKGFGKKREMLTAQLNAEVNHNLVAPWFSLPDTPYSQKTVSIIGGGIAGCQMAYALATRGWQVTLIERHAQLASEASGNRAGVLTPKMTAESSWGESFYRQAFGFANRQLQQLTAQGFQLDWQACGAMQLAHESRELARQQTLSARQLPTDFIQLVDAATASAIAGIPLKVGASYFPQGGWLNPRSLCQALIQHQNIHVIFNETALDLKQNANQTWHVLDSNHNLISEADVLIIANGKDLTSFSQTKALPLMPVQGQTTTTPVSHYSQALKLALGHEGYITPAIQGQHIFGATFKRNQVDIKLDSASDQTNYQQLQQYLPELANSFATMQSSHAAIRMTTPDRYPIVGAMPDITYYQAEYASLKHGQKYRQYPKAHYIQGLYVLGGFGSRGLATGGLCAKLLAAIINHEPLPIQKTLYENLQPARFLIKQLKTGNLSK